MSTQYIVDRTAVLSVQMSTSSPPDVYQCWNGWVQRGEMTFASEIVPLLKRREQGQMSYVWLSAISSARSHTGAGYTVQTHVARSVPGVVDPDVETGAVETLAQAVELNGVVGNKAVVVTEDTEEKPTRMALSEACAQLGIDWLALPDFLVICGCDGFLA